MWRMGSVTQWCPTLGNPLDCSLPGSSVPGLFQARILEWVAISYSRGSSPPRDRSCVSCVSCIDRWILYLCATWEALFDNSYSKIGVRQYLMVVLILCVSDEGCWASFHVPVGHLYAFFGKMSVQNLCSFKNQIVGFLLLVCTCFLMHFGYYSLITYMISKYFLPYSKLFLYFGDGFLHWAKAIQFDVILLVYFCICCLLVSSRKKVVTKTAVKELTVYIFF